METITEKNFNQVYLEKLKTNDEVVVFYSHSQVYYLLKVEKVNKGKRLPENYTYVLSDGREYNYSGLCINCPFEYPAYIVTYLDEDEISTEYVERKNQNKWNQIKNNISKSRYSNSEMTKFMTFYYEMDVEKKERERKENTERHIRYFEQQKKEKLSKGEV